MPSLVLYGMRSQLKFVITTGLLCHLFLAAPLVTSQALPAQQAPPAAEQGGNCHLLLTRQPQTGGAAPGEKKAPKISISEAQPVDIRAGQCEKNGDLYTLRGNVEIKFGDYTFHGETVTYDAESGDVTSTGNSSFDGGMRDIHITASHATYNIRTRTGKFYDVAGTTGTRFQGKNVALTSSNPVAFTGRIVQQTGPEEYELQDGSVTSCELPHPKWTFNASRITLRVGVAARVYNSTFQLKGVPIFYLPYVSPPVERLGRQSGFLIPNFGSSRGTTSKGTILGDQFYWAINRSMDATLGGEYFSRRGWSLRETFRAKPSDNSYLNFNYFQVLDRGIVQNVPVPGDPTGQTVRQKVNQGGEDIKLTAESNFANGVRGVASIDYLSSFLFRLVFTENFSQAVDSEVRSVAFLSRSTHGFSFNAYGSRYQNFQSTSKSDVITILHTPAVELSGVEQRILKSPFYWSYDVDAEGLRRTEPTFVTPGLVGRFDIDPVISLPLVHHGWTLQPEVELRNTVYTQRQVLEVLPGNASAQNVPTHDLLNRRTIEGRIEFRPPALARVFDKEFLGRKWKHTIEPRVLYRYTNGVERFSSIIHFDLRDILSNTNEVEYGLVQRLYLKHAGNDCAQQPAAAQNQQGGTPAAESSCTPAGGDEFLSWEVKQKYFLDPNFGGAILNGRRNVLASTVDFTGIAFLTDPRHFAPIVSRLRMRTSSNSDLEWQLDYDTKKGRINSSTFYSTLHFGNFLVQASHAFMQDPGEIVTVLTPSGSVTLPPCKRGQFNSPTQCVPPVFNQLRALIGYGSPSKRGWSAAVNAGVDSEFNLVQYSAAQTGYNWDCCGVNFEYRRFSLGQVRNENQYRFSFTLANIGSFGNLKRQTRLF